MRSWLVLLALAAGCAPDTALKSYNNDPVATIVSHQDGDEVREGYPVSFVGTLSDANNEADQLTATWYSGATTLCEEAPVDAAGSTTCTTVLSPDNTEITLQARDPANATGLARVTLVVVPTVPPVATITAPDGTGPYYNDVPVQIGGVVSDAEDTVAELVVAWTDGDGTSLAADTTPDGSGVLSDALVFATGTQTLTLTVTDQTGKTGTDSVSFVVGGANTPPSCTLRTPEDGGAAEPGDRVTLAGVVTDPDVDASRRTATWSSDHDGALGTSPIEADGSTILDVDTLSYGTHVLTLTGADEVGASCTDTVSFTVGDAPTITIDTPTDGDVWNDGVSVPFSALVADDSTPPEELAIVWESDLDGVLDLGPADDTGLARFDEAGLRVGTHVVTLTVTDAGGLTAEASVELRVNGLPGAPIVAIAPASPATDDALVATVTADAVDPEGDPITYTWAWTVDGAPTAYTTDKVPASATSRGEVWAVEVTPDDGWGAGDVGTTSVAIGDQAPVLASVVLGPDPAREGDVLTCTPGAATDADGDVVTYGYAWIVDGAAVAATGSTLDDSWWSRGDPVFCTVTPNDGSAAGAAVSSNVVTITDAPPTLTGVELSPEPAYADDTLTCTAVGFADADGDADATDFAWSIDGVTVGTGDTLDGVFVGGDEVVCTATPNDTFMDGDPRSTSVVIANTAPVLASVSLTPASPGSTDTLTCTPGATTDADGTTTFTYTTSWTVDGATVAATTSTLAPSFFDVGDVVVCSVRPDDGEDVGAAVSSGAVTIGNSVPVVTLVTVSPSSPRTNDTLTAVATGSDGDGDVVTLSYAWYVNGLAVGVTTPTLAGTWFARGDSVYVVVTPADPHATGAGVPSSIVTIANTPPSLTGAVIAPSSATASTTLSCAAAGFSDADGDSDATSFAWSVDGVSVGTGPTLAGVFVHGDVVTCTATPFDGTDAGTAATTSISVGNTGPVLASVVITPASPDVSSTLTCTPGTTTDADGTTSFTYTYAWRVDGTGIAPTTATLTSAYFDRGDSVSCSATPSDGTTAGSAVVSDAVTIGNAAPTVSTVSLTPTTAYEASTLTCTASGADADGDSVSFGYAWIVDGATITPTSTTLTGTWFGKGNVVSCRVTPDDGTTTGTAVSSSSVTIGNTAPSAPTVVIDPADPEAGVDAIICSIDSAGADVDGDTIAYTFSWTRNGAAYTGASSGGTSSTVPASATARDDVFVCTAVTTDGSASSSASAAASVEVLGASYYIGYPDEFESKSISTGSIALAQAITVSSACDLYQLGIISKEAGSNTSFALYADSAGRPGALVATTGVGYAAAGRLELDVVGAPIALSAGTYWFAYTFDTRGYIAYTPTTDVIVYKSLPWGSAFPNPFGTGSTSTGHLLNVYGIVR